MTPKRMGILQTLGSAGLVALLSACGASAPAVGTVRMGAPRPSLPPTCALEFVAVTPGDMAPGQRFGGGNGYAMVGAVTIGADTGTDAMSEPIRQLVRPRACAMGGEAVTLQSSGEGSFYSYNQTLGLQSHGQQNIVFTVWARPSVLRRRLVGFAVGHTFILGVAWLGFRHLMTGLEVGIGGG